MRELNVVTKVFGTVVRTSETLLFEQDLYVEVKGYEAERDRAKWSVFPFKLMIVKKKEIDEIQKGTFAPVA